MAEASIMHGLHVFRRISMWPASGPQRHRIQRATSPRSRGAWGEAPHPPDPLTCRSASGPAGLCPDPAGVLARPRTPARARLGPVARPSGPPSAALRSGPRAPPSAHLPGSGVAWGERAPPVSQGPVAPIVAPVSVPAGARGVRIRSRRTASREEVSRFFMGGAAYHLLARWIDRPDHRTCRWISRALRRPSSSSSSSRCARHG